MNIPSIFWIVPAASVVALSFAWAFYRLMKREDEGTPRMREIAAHVRKGAMAYLRQQYKVVGIVFAVLALFFAWLAYGAGVQNGWVPFAFITGGFFSGLAGYFGMKTATYASARTANAARQSLDRGLKVAFRSGAVMGLVVVGLGLLDISFWYVILNHFVEVAGPQKLVVITTTMLTFGMGASTQALFARVGGGIYTKAADVGADLVGKVEAGIPEDDPRNPATIADNVGDNVGDVAGMGADLFESYVGALVSALTLGVAVVGTFNGAGRRGLLLGRFRGVADQGRDGPDADRRGGHPALDPRHLPRAHEGGGHDARTAPFAGRGRQFQLAADRRRHVRHPLPAGRRELGRTLVLGHHGPRGGHCHRAGHGILYLPFL